MKITKGYINFDDGTIYPRAGRSSDISWICRHGDEKAILKNKMMIASILSAYSYLLDEAPMAYAKKKLSEIRRAEKTVIKEKDDSF